MDQWKRTESPKIKPDIYGQLISENSVKKLNGELVVKKKMVLGQSDGHIKQNEVGSLPHTDTKINSKWMTDLNVRTETIKLPEESRGVNVHDVGFGKGFLDTISPLTQTV